MAKQRNDNIGHMPCPMKGCAQVAAVRKNRTGKLYCDCPDCGRLTPNLSAGQGRMMDSAILWGAGGPPADCPRWIAEQWPWGRVKSDPSGLEPIGGPVNGDSPVEPAAPLTGEPETPPVDRGYPAPPPPPVEQPPQPAPAESEPEPDYDGFDFLR